MKLFIRVMIFCSFAALGAYLGANEYKAQSAYYTFTGVLFGFLYRHLFYKEEK